MSAHDSTMVYNDPNKTTPGFNESLLKLLFNAIQDSDELGELFGYNFLDQEWILRHDIEGNVVVPYIMVLGSPDGTIICNKVIKVFSNSEVTVFTRGGTSFFFSTKMEKEEKDLHDNIVYR